MQVINVKLVKPGINVKLDNIRMIGTAAIDKICILDLREYNALDTRSPDTLYFVRG